MKFEKKVKVKGKEFLLVAEDELIMEGALHTLDGKSFSPLMNIDSVGDTPASFSPDRAFYNPVMTEKDKLRKEQLVKAAEGHEFKRYAKE